MYTAQHNTHHHAPTIAKLLNHQLELSSGVSLLGEYKRKKVNNNGQMMEDGM
jgi:hypothetical protein